MRGKNCAEPVSLVDLYPTLIDVCHLPKQDGLSGAEIGARLVLDSATITGGPDRLETLGLIQRTADSGDRRVNRIRLTAAGRDRREPLQAVMDGLNAEIASGFGGEAETLWRLLRQLAAHPQAARET